ncbi:MAG: DNA gyrase subunit A [Clostridiales bacterium]|nr:DNA gyrase subunit A [Clostridiales bacterium]
MESQQDRIVDVNIEKEMSKSFMDYAMSVIVSRALPDVRDGLKPVHRRILYSMFELGMTSDKPFRKSARIVGDVLGKYHPHGDSSVYDAMVRMAQDFSIRYMLIEGHGNFGSVDGDSAAAMRYTEARMSKISMELLADINKDTVDFSPNFDETLKEPQVLPSRFPNLLVNGSAGIAVGMATNIPPHNLGEVIDGVVALIDNPEITIDELINHIKGPDFPTGGLILGREGLLSAYRTGRGRIVTRAKTQIEEFGNDRFRIAVSEIPYQVNKSRLIEKIADLVRDKRIEGISDVRDESDRTGMRIVIDVKRDANPNVVLNYLFKHTQMQDTFGAIMLALVDGQPRVMNLKEILSHYIAHQKDVIIRRTKYDLNRAEARAHILEGLLIALDHIDEIIKIIRASENDQVAKENLIEKFALSEKQAQAILDMRLRRLTGLEREKLLEEYEALLKTIRELRSILAEDHLQFEIIKEELLNIKDKYNDERRTEITSAPGEIDLEDLIDEHDAVLTLTHLGYIKRIPLDTYKSQRRGGRGITGLQTRQEDFVANLFVTSTHHRLLFFTSLGKVYELKGYEIPEAGRQARGTAIINLIQLMPGERIQAVIPVNGSESEKFLLMGTRNGLVKKSPLKEYKNIRKGGLIAINLREGDEVIGVSLTDGDSDIMLASHKGMSIRFHESQVRSMGRASMGVKGMHLGKGDYVIDMELADSDSQVLAISENGYGKRTPLEEYRPQRRGGRGIITMRTTDKTGKLVALKMVDEDDDLMIINSEGIIIRIGAKQISTMSRNTQGVTLMRVEEGMNVISVAKAEKDGDDPEKEDEEI